MNVFTPNRFLKALGLILLLVSISGLIGVLGPNSSQSVLSNSWWLDSHEIMWSGIIGFFVLLSAFFFPPLWQRYLAVVIGLAALFIGLYSFLSPVFFGVHIEVPVEMIAVLAIGAWGLYAVYGNVRGGDK